METSNCQGTQNLGDQARAQSDDTKNFLMWLSSSSSTCIQLEMHLQGWAFPIWKSKFTLCKLFGSGGPFGVAVRCLFPQPGRATKATQARPSSQSFLASACLVFCGLALPCPVSSCLALSCRVLLHLSYLVLSFLVLPFVVSCLVLSCLVLSCVVLCLALPCYALLCLVLSCRVLSCRVLC